MAKRIMLNARMAQNNMKTLMGEIEGIAQRIELIKEEVYEIEGIWEGDAENVWVKNMQSILLKIEDDVYEFRKIIQGVDDKLCELKDTMTKVQKLFNTIGML